MNPCQQIRIEKITLNIGAGTNIDKLEKGLKLLEMITAAKPVKTLSTKRIAGWGIRPGLPIGCKVTIRGPKAMTILKQLLGGIDNKLKPKQFDDEGNLSFGMKEYIDVPGLEYSPEIGSMGFQVCATLERPGFRVKKRNVNKKKLGKKHKITRKDAIEFMKSNFKAIIEEE